MNGQMNGSNTKSKTDIGEQQNRKYKRIVLILKIKELYHSEPVCFKQLLLIYCC
jgi:hypothetical protein